MVGGGFAVILTLETELTHGGFEMVHAKTFTPRPKPEIVVVGDKEFVIVPLPETKVQAPVPVTAVFAFMVALEVAQTV